VIQAPGRIIAATALIVLALGAAGGFGAAMSSSQPTLMIATAAGERLAFEPAEVRVADPGPLEIVFRNGSSLEHNLVFVQGIDARTQSIVEPATSETLSVRLDRPGTYEFVCTIHEGMAGSIVVEGARTSP
jgi:plastocyanin